MVISYRLCRKLASLFCRIDIHFVINATIAIFSTNIGIMVHVVASIRIKGKDYSVLMVISVFENLIVS